MHHFTQIKVEAIDETYIFSITLHLSEQLQVHDRSLCCIFHYYSCIIKTTRVRTYTHKRKLFVFHICAFFHANTRSGFCFIVLCIHYTYMVIIHESYNCVLVRGREMFYVSKTQTCVVQRSRKISVKKGNEFKVV